MVTSGGRADYVRPGEFNLKFYIRKSFLKIINFFVCFFCNWLGESFRLTCVYLPEKDETLKLIQWDLDGEVVRVYFGGFDFVNQITFD